jgi:hypothetical protein
MTSHDLQSLLPGMAPTTPHVALLRVVVFDHVAHWGHRVWRALEALGQRRAERELLALAERWKEINPALSRELRFCVRGGSSC